jgi:hypothetical protein
MFERGEQGAQEAFFGFRLQGLAALAVDAHHLLMARDDAGFHRGYTPRVGEHAFVNDAGVAQTLAQGRARFVISYRAEALHPCPEGAQICRYVACAAEAFALLNEIDNRDGGFRGKARSGAPKIAVQHEVAEDADAFSAQAGD